MTPPLSLFIVRLSADVSTKSPRTRAGFSALLQNNIRGALKASGLRGRVMESRGRILLFTPHGRKVQGLLPRIFGISNFSHIAARCTAEMGEMEQLTAREFLPLIKGRRYAVRARRNGKHPFSSPDVERQLGAILRSAGTVDLDDPEITVHVEINGRRAFFFTERTPGAGGLPLGTEGRALALLSGGFDSAVAAWQIMRRGVSVDFVFCNLAGAAYERQVIQVAKVLTDLWAPGSRPRLHVVDFAELVRNLRSRVNPRFWQVILKRQMYRAATELAHRTGAQALITGEAIGQVSSQTLANLRAIEPATDMLVLRPLVGLDKAEIMEQAHRIGTGILSERIPEHCSLGGRSPSVGTSARKAGTEEAAVDEALLREAVEGARTIRLAEVTGADLQSDYLFIEDVPEGARVIDCQPPAHYAHWHLPGAVNLTPDAVLRKLKQFDKKRRYVLYCQFGTQSAHLAELMQQYGYEAYALRGGLGAIRQRLEAAESFEDMPL